MKAWPWSVALACLSVIVATSIAAQQPAGGGQPAQRPPAGGGGGGMILSTPAFADGAQIPARYTQVGEQMSPPLNWTNAPPNTASFVLHLHDVEVARNRTTEDQMHWLLWNIPGTASGLPENLPKGADLPDGTRQVSATGPGVYRGPGAPANGPMHHYMFELFALDTKLDVAATGGDVFETRAAVLKAIQGHILGKAVYVGLFRRPQ